VAWTVDAARSAGTSVALRFCDGLELGRKVVQLEVLARQVRRARADVPWQAALHRPQTPPRADLSEAERIQANCQQGRDDSVSMKEISNHT